jgi:hypothetical protein
MVYHPTYAVFARTVNFVQKSGGSFVGRGVYSSQPYDVPTEDGLIFSDQRTILDILEVEYTTLPVQGDSIEIPEDGTLPELGFFDIIDVDSNGGGELTLTIRKQVVSKP